MPRHNGIPLTSTHTERDDMGIANPPEWGPWGQCATLDNPDAMFPNDADIIGIAIAKNVCALCQYKTECLEFALAHETSGRSRYGVWGGKTPRERANIATRRYDATRPGRRVVNAVPKCGTLQGARAHDEAGEEQCGPCKRIVATAEKVSRRKRAEKEKADLAEAKRIADEWMAS